MTKAVALFDGQNIYHMLRHAFGNLRADFNPKKLAMTVCNHQKWNLVEARYYTGIHSTQENPKLNAVMQSHLDKMASIGVHTYARTLHYQNGIAREKGIDMRIALDAVRIVHSRSADVVLLFSQDQDFVELAEEFRQLNRSHKSAVKIACAFPEKQGFRGIDKTDWITFS